MMPDFSLPDPHHFKNIDLIAVGRLARIFPNQRIP